jgi:hypothetical protein
MCVWNCWNNFFAYCCGSSNYYCLEVVFFLRLKIKRRRKSFLSYMLFFALHDREIIFISFCAKKPSLEWLYVCICNLHFSHLRSIIFLSECICFFSKIYFNVSTFFILYYGVYFFLNPAHFSRFMLTEEKDVCFRFSCGNISFYVWRYQRILHTHLSSSN